MPDVVQVGSDTVCHGVDCLNKETQEVRNQVSLQLLL